MKRNGYTAKLARLLHAVVTTASAHWNGEVSAYRYRAGMERCPLTGIEQVHTGMERCPLTGIEQVHTGCPLTEQVHWNGRVSTIQV